MKKLLSLLSVLTISGSAIPTIIAASPYQKSENLNRNKRNLENIKPIISILGSDGQERGMINLDILNKKINFISVSNNIFTNSSDWNEFITIVIRDNQKNMIKFLRFPGYFSMQNVITAYVLTNGIGYSDGYSIEIISSQANKTRFIKNDNNNNYWVWNISEGSNTEKFILMNNKMWEPNILIEKFPNLISRPLIRRTNNNNQNIHAPDLVIDEWDDNLSQYYDSLISVVDYLNREGIIEQFGRTNGTYRLTNQNGYFIIGIQFQGLSSLNNTVELVFDRSNLYLQGFILREDNGRQNSAHGTYYYFSDSTYRTNLGINHLTNVNLNFGGSYTNLIADGDLNISSQSLFNSFRFLASFNNSNQQRINISSNLMRIILATSESLRFNNIISTIQNNNNPISWRNYFSNLLTNWGSMSQDIIRRINNGIQHGIQFHDPVNDNSSRISPALMTFLLNVRILNNK